MAESVPDERAVIVAGLQYFHQTASLLPGGLMRRDLFGSHPDGGFVNARRIGIVAPDEKNLSHGRDNQ
jgi:hypothetical protein